MGKNALFSRFLGVLGIPCSSSKLQRLFWADVSYQNGFQPNKYVRKKLLKT